MQHLKSSTKLVHLSIMDDFQPLCKIQHMQLHPLTETTWPVTCSSCTKSLELVIRHQMSNLSAAGMTKVLDLISMMRNGELRE